MKKLSQEEFDRYLNIKGETRGFSIKNDIEYLRKIRGEEAVERLEKRMAELGAPVDFDELKEGEFSPLGLEVSMLAVMEELFDLTEEEIEGMGRFNAKASHMASLFIKYFVSLDSLQKYASELWDRFFTVGSFEIKEVDVSEGRAVIVMKEFPPVPEIYCRTNTFFFSEALELVVRKPVEVKETKCPRFGDENHEFELSWDPSG